MINVLLLYRELIPSVRLCAYEQLKYLDDKGDIYFLPCQINKLNKRIINMSDVVIYVRADSYFERKLSFLLRKSGKKQFYILDDDLLGIPSTASSYLHYNDEIIRENIITILQNCDFLLSPSQNILNKYGHYVKSTGRIEESVPLYFKKQKQINTSIKIGFAGSIDRENDISAIMSEALILLQKKYGDIITIEFFGVKPPLTETNSFNYYPYCTNYDEYQLLMDELNWDIGIAPMPDTDFHKFKHYNKLIEYSAYGIAGVYSNVTPYKEIIINEFNGIICDNTTEEWVNAISKYIDDSQLRVNVIENCQGSQFTDFSIESSSNLLYSFLDSYDNDQFKVIYFFNLLKLQCFFIKFYSYIKRNKFKSLMLIFKKIMRN